MTAERRPVAFFARGIDGFYLLDEALCRGVALLRDDTPEADWARRFWPAEDCLTYQAPADCEDQIYPSTEEILLGSDLGQRLVERGVRELLLSSALTGAIDDWATRYGIRLWAPEFRDRAPATWLENKSLFDEFLEHHSLPRPASHRFAFGQPFTPPAGWRLDSPVVLQRAESLGGEGTFFFTELSRVAGFLAVQTFPDSESLLLREMLPEAAYGITLLVTPQRINLSSIRQQCYYPAESGRQAFAGIQWIPDEYFSPELLDEINQVFVKLGERLWEMGFVGLANCDFMFDRSGNVRIIECNPRMSAATPQLFLHSGLGGTEAIGPSFLECFSRPARRATTPQITTIPNSTYAGCTLDIAALPGDAGATIPGDFASGVYSLASSRLHYQRADIRRLAPDELAIFIFAAAGQTVTADTTFATVLAEQSLYGLDSFGSFGLSDASLMVLEAIRAVCVGQ